MSDPSIILCKNFILILRHQRTYQMDEPYFEEFHESNFVNAKMRPDLNMKLDMCYSSTTFFGNDFIDKNYTTQTYLFSFGDKRISNQYYLYPQDNRLVIVDKDEIVHVFDCYAKMLY